MIKAEPKSTATTQPLLDSLAQRWNSLSDFAEQLWLQLETAKNQATSRGNELERLALWLEDVIHELKSNKPIGGLPETARAQLDDYRILAADVEQKRIAVESELERLEEHFADSEKLEEKEKFKNSYLERQYEQLKKSWGFINVTLF